MLIKLDLFGALLVAISCFLLAPPLLSHLPLPPPLLLPLAFKFTPSRSLTKKMVAPIIRMAKMAAAAEAKMEVQSQPSMGVAAPLQLVKLPRFRSPLLSAPNIDAHLSGFNSFSIAAEPGIATTQVLEGGSGQFQLTFPHGRDVENGVAGFAIALGVLLVLLGVRLFRILLFGTVALFSGCMIYYIGMQVKDAGSKDCFIAACVLGVILGALAVKVWKLSLFMIGAFVGATLWYVFQSLWPNALGSPVSAYITLTICMLVLGFLALKMEKIALLFFTPILGAFVLLQGVDHFTSMNLNVFEGISPEGRLKICSGGQASLCYGMYALLLSISFFGMFVQWKWTADMSSREAARKKKKIDENSKPNEMVILASPKTANKNNTLFASPTSKGGSFSSSNSSSMGLNPFASPTSTSSSSPSFGNPFSSRRSAYSQQPQRSVESEYFEG